MTRVLITGGSGTIGKRLTQLLISQGIEVRWLSRNKKSNSHIVVYEWDIEREYIEDKAFYGVDFIIHLAGVGIFDKRWSKAYKKKIADSRIKSTELLFRYISKKSYPLKGFISASAIGYYGTTNSTHIHTERDSHANDFLGNICESWEKSARRFSNELNIRSVQFRTGVVLSKSGGALSKLLLPIRLGIGAYLGSGKQYMPCIHIDDLCKLYIHALGNTAMTGAYNATMPEQLTNREVVKILAKQLKKTLWLPPVPSFVLYIFLGERANVLLKGSKVTPQRILANTEFTFSYPCFIKAITECLHP